MIYCIIVIITIEFLDQCRTVIQQQLTRTIGIKIDLISMSFSNLIFKSFPFLKARAIRPTADVLLAAPNDLLKACWHTSLLYGKMLQPTKP